MSVGSISRDDSQESIPQPLKPWRRWWMTPLIVLYCAVSLKKERLSRSAWPITQALKSQMTFSRCSVEKEIQSAEKIWQAIVGLKMEGATWEGMWMVRNCWGWPSDNNHQRNRNLSPMIPYVCARNWLLSMIWMSLGGDSTPELPSKGPAQGINIGLTGAWRKNWAELSQTCIYRTVR